MAHAYGLRVLGTAGSSEGRERVIQSGADVVFDHTEQGYMDKIVAYTGGQGPDIILEMVANVCLAKDLDIIKKFGTIVMVGHLGPVEINPIICILKECVVTGVMVYNINKNEWDEIHAAIEAGARVGWLNPKVGRVFPLAEARQAHEEMAKHGEQKIVLKI